MDKQMIVKVRFDPFECFQDNFQPKNEVQQTLKTSFYFVDKSLKKLYFQVEVIENFKTKKENAEDLQHTAIPFVGFWANKSVYTYY